MSLPTFADGLSPTRTIHVDASATGGGNGSAAAPYQTLKQAEGAATPGTDVRVHGELTATSAIGALAFTGTAAAPIWITGELGARLRGVDVAALRLVGAHYLVVRDLELLEGPDHVLHFDNSDHLLFQRVHAHRAREACMKGSQATNVYVEDSDFHGAGELSGGNSQSTQVFDWVGVNTGHIVRSRLHDGSNVMLMLKGGTSDVLVARNEIYHQTATGESAVQVGQSTGPQYFQPQNADHEALRVVAFANVVHDLDGPAFAFQGAHDCAGVHNTFFDVRGGQLVRYLPGAAGTTSGITISNNVNDRFTGNIVVGTNSGGASMNSADTSLGVGNAADHNVWFKPGALNWWSALAQESATSTYTTDPSLNAGGVPGNVSLVDGKGATNLGGIAFSQVFVRDFTGKCVAFPLDLGAIDVP